MERHDMQRRAVAIGLLSALCMALPASARAEPPRPGAADDPHPRPCARHDQKVAAVRSGTYDLVLIGDSITQTVGDLGDAYVAAKATWDRHYAPRNAINLGFNGYRTEELLWNLQNGQLDFARSPKVFMLLVGTNNTAHSPEQIFAGTKAIVDLIRERHPTSKILVLRIFPRGGAPQKSAVSWSFATSPEDIERCRRAGELTRQLADDEHVFWLDVNHVFLRPDGTIDTDLMWDLLHPSPKGIEAWAQAVEPTLARLMGDTPIVDPALLAAMTMSGRTQAPQEEFNYDEAKVRPYTLPALLAGPDGATIDSPDAWRTMARPRWMKLLAEEEYGRVLRAVPVTAAQVEQGEGPGGSQRIQARLRLGHGPDAPTTEVLLYVPGPSRGERSGRLPTFLHLNFGGNHAETADPAVWIPQGWVPNDKDTGVTDNRARPESRGSLAHRWPIEKLTGRGYATATAYYGDTFPDRADGRASSALPSLGFTPDDARAAPDEPGAISTWAWHLSRILDWLMTLPEIDATRVIVVGHSRLGKTALWAGAGDERFAMVVANESGCGGAALERRNVGETVKRITTSFPHWFCPKFAGWAGREAEMPIDQHVVLAMIAPRPLYVASAAEDLWADPRGEFLGCLAAEPVWRLFGREGLGTDTFPAVDAPVGRTIGYHVRTGKHDILEADWDRFADFADRLLPPRP